MTFDVIRQHLGDKLYLPGDTREANKADVQHLIDNGVLAEPKAAPVLKNKAEPPVRRKNGG